MTGDEMEIIEVLEVDGALASVRRPDTRLEVWALVKLPSGVVPGDRGAVLMEVRL
ncbi:hypothetical protein K7W42_12715 [Deinococcus sp. HMF7604]|uniref:hypothetical protein n=1 Tax=Deinococcus betulae TaxID=2873312 RepID=UPI001CCF409C|nr:hypothetical protein [Deinococcus betulae]MBZ9751725.1 hypothetical protein [Deinococcus betulae]